MEQMEKNQSQESALRANVHVLLESPGKTPGSVLGGSFRTPEMGNVRSRLRLVQGSGLSQVLQSIMGHVKECDVYPNNSEQVFKTMSREGDTIQQQSRECDLRRGHSLWKLNPEGERASLRKSQAASSI